MIPRLIGCAAWLLLAGASAAPPGAAGMPSEGQPAPDIDLPAVQVGKALPDHADAKTLRLSDLRGKNNVVLYFFPKALTSG
jgi:peroxiredoxin